MKWTLDVIDASGKRAVYRVDAPDRLTAEKALVQMGLTVIYEPQGVGVARTGWRLLLFLVFASCAAMLPATESLIPGLLAFALLIWLACVSGEEWTVKAGRVRCQDTAYLKCLFASLAASPLAMLAAAFQHSPDWVAIWVLWGFASLAALVAWCVVNLCRALPLRGAVRQDDRQP